jgi:hypothetical protein
MTIVTSQGYAFFEASSATFEVIKVRCRILPSQREMTLAQLNSFNSKRACADSSTARAHIVRLSRLSRKLG